MKRILIILLMALTASVSMAQAPVSYGIPPQLSQAEQQRLDSIWRDHQRASFYIQRSANLQLVMIPVAVVGTTGGLLLCENGESTQLAGGLIMGATGIATVILWIVQNRSMHKAGKLLERVRIEQNGVTIRL